MLFFHLDNCVWCVVAVSISDVLNMSPDWILIILCPPGTSFNLQLAFNLPPWSNHRTKDKCVTVHIWFYKWQSLCQFLLYFSIAPFLVRWNEKWPLYASKATNEVIAVGVMNFVVNFILLIISRRLKCRLGCNAVHWDCVENVN